MYISEIKEIKNYRNLSGKKITFDESMNFLVGENNIGKTNILELINILLSQSYFKENDFNDVCEPIKIVFTIKYNIDELGFFENSFDVEDTYAITIVGEQSNVDGRIEYYHNVPTKTPIYASTIKKLNTLYYYAQRTPSKEINFRKNQGSGRILNYLIKRSLENKGINESDVLKYPEINGVVGDVNSKISNLNIITGDNIKAYINNGAEQIISGILEIGDQNNRDLNSLGQGIQYAFNIFLQILDIIHGVKTSRREDDFENRLIVNEETKKKYFPLILILDEPEIHQHPYRQRSLIRKIEELMKNENAEFVELLEDLFGINGITGQLFIATHSPNILLSDYKQFIRVYKNINSCEEELVISSKSVDLDKGIYKHLLHNYIYLKEAMFSKGIIFVEGDTEYGAIPIFASRLGFNLDENGIGVIKLDGADSVKKCLELYDSFGIRAVAIIDKDKYDSYSDVQNVYFTEEEDFEEDVYTYFELSDYLKFNKEMGTLNCFIGILKRYNITVHPQEFLEDPLSQEIPVEVQVKILEEIKTKELESLRKSKNASKGTLLATYVTNVPNSYKDTINALKYEPNKDKSDKEEVQ